MWCISIYLSICRVSVCLVIWLSNFYLAVCTCVCISVCLSACMPVCLYVCMYVCIDKRTSEYRNELAIKQTEHIYICMHIDTYVFVYVYYIHIHTPSSTPDPRNQTRVFSGRQWRWFLLPAAKCAWCSICSSSPAFPKGSYKYLCREYPQKS